MIYAALRRSPAYMCGCGAAIEKCQRRQMSLAAYTLDTERMHGRTYAVVSEMKNKVVSSLSFDMPAGAHAT